MNEIDFTPKMKHYISTIYEICSESSVARITDIASNMGVSKSNVSNIMRDLAEKGIVNFKPYGFVTITGEFQEKAERLSDMKKAFQDFLQHELSLPGEMAERNADAVFYLNDDLVINRMKEMLDHQKNCCKHDSERIQWSENDEIICPY